MGVNLLNRLLAHSPPTGPSMPFITLLLVFLVSVVSFFWCVAKRRYGWAALTIPLILGSAYAAACILV